MSPRISLALKMSVRSSRTSMEPLGNSSRYSSFYVEVALEENTRGRPPLDERQQELFAWGQ